VTCSFVYPVLSVVSRRFPVVDGTGTGRMRTAHGPGVAVGDSPRPAPGSAPLRPVPRHDELTVLLRSARTLSMLCRDGTALVTEARESQAPPSVVAAARQMHSTLLRTKHEAEDVLVAFVLDCNRCGRRVHWVPGEGCELGHWAHAEPAPDDPPAAAARGAKGQASCHRAAANNCAERSRGRWFTAADPGYGFSMTCQATTTLLGVLLDPGALFR
jgi:hypothetical protein